MITRDMLIDAVWNPVLSREHKWNDGEQEQYDSLKAPGRRLYDNLRTKFNIPHDVAYQCAVENFGTKGRGW